MTRAILAQPVEAGSDILPYIGSGWLAQEKLDGVRLAIAYGVNGRPLHSLLKGDVESGLLPVFADQMPSLPAGSIVDGEVIGGWEGALSKAGSGLIDQWRPFDYVSPEPLLDRLAFLRIVGFGEAVVPAGPVAEVWGSVLRKGGEGIVVRRASAGYGVGPIFKLKPARLLNCIAMRGHLMVLDGSTPHAVGQCDSKITGRVIVACEGATRHRKVRAPRVLGPAASDANVSISQLERLVISS